MEAKDIVLAARKEYLEINQDEQFKKAFEKVESLRVEADGEVEELKGYEPNEDLTNYVFNKLLEKARKEGGNVFMGECKDLYEYIFEFYTDYENLKDQFEDKWSMYIRGVSNNSTSKSKKKSVSDTLEDADALAAKEKKLEEEFKKKEEALKKAAIKEYKEAEAKKKEEAKLKAEEEKKRKEEEAKRKEQEESESLGGLFDLL